MNTFPHFTFALATFIVAVSCIRYPVPEIKTPQEPSTEEETPDTTIPVPAIDSSTLGGLARARYLKSFRTDVPWNQYALKFTYAPFLDFSSNSLSAAQKSTVKKYRYTVYYFADKNKSYIAYGDFKKNFINKGYGNLATATKQWSFDSTSPVASLAPIWDDVTVGYVWLVVNALDDKENVVGEVGSRGFLRDYPFTGAATSPARDYRTSAILATEYINSLAGVKSWKTSSLPNVSSYTHYCYPNKTIGETIAMEVKYATEQPSASADAILIAKQAASYLMGASRPKSSTIAYFPPTYYGSQLAAKSNAGKTMTMDACYSAQAFLDLYDYTGEQQYYTHAKGIADSFVRIQLSDGSFYSKIYFNDSQVADGTPATQALAMLHPVLSLFERFRSQYGIQDYVNAQRLGEKWMREVAISSFDIHGQFEDVSVEKNTYENLTNVTASNYASYLLRKTDCDATDIANARDLIRLSEDQFVYWNIKSKSDGSLPFPVPCVFEQYSYAKPIDCSACNVANAYLDLYEKTGDKLAYAKGKALVDQLTNVQIMSSGSSYGKIPTTWTSMGSEPWINCTNASIKILYRMAELAGK